MNGMPVDRCWRNKSVELKGTVMRSKYIPKYIKTVTTWEIVNIFFFRFL